MAGTQKSALQRAALAYGEIVMGKRGTPAMRIVAVVAFIAVGTVGGISAARMAGDTPKAQAGAVATTATASVKWDGNPNHADCTPGGHPDPDHPGQLTSDEDSDDPCVPNAPIKTLDTKPYTKAELGKNDRDWKRFSETARSPRWIDALNTAPGDVDEFYELPGETGEDACAEVAYSPTLDNAYTVSVLNAKHEVRMSTRHMAEVAAVAVCGNGRRP